MGRKTAFGVFFPHKLFLKLSNQIFSEEGMQIHAYPFTARQAVKVFVCVSLSIFF